MTNLETEIYTLMDQFLTDGDKPRSLENLNKDRKLFVDNLKFAVMAWALDCLGEDEEYGKPTEENIIWTSARIGLRSEIRQRIRESIGEKNE